MNEDNQTEVILGEDDELKALHLEFLNDVTERSDALESVTMTDEALGPWSHSKLKVLEKCQFHFYLAYVLKAKLPPKLAAMQDTTLADVGSSAHRILELVFTGHTVQSAYAMAKAEFVPAKLTEELWAERIETVEYNITAFKERIDAFKARHKVKKIYTELRLGVTKDWKPTRFFADNVFYRGIVDFVMMLENGDIIIVDWKFGPPAASGIRNYKQQLDSYKPLIHFGLIPIKGATSGVGFVREGELILGEFDEVEKIEGKLKNAIEWNIQGSIDATLENGFFKHVAGNQCKYCPYQDLCKSKQLKPVELSTKRFFEIKQA